MAVEIKMPQLSDTMDKGSILAWRKKEGDLVKRGDVLAEVATDKADLEIESFEEGILLSIRAQEGASVGVGEVIAVIGLEGEKVEATQISQSSPFKSEENIKQSKAGEKQVNELNEGESINTPNNFSEISRIKITPLAKNIAKNMGVDIAQVSGSGEGGRIVKRDLESFLAVQSGNSGEILPLANEGKATVDGRRTELSKMRQAIAKRMVESVNTIPHFFVTVKVLVNKLADVRLELKSHPLYEGITINHLLIKALGLAAANMPKVNSRYQDGYLISPSVVNVGIVTALPDGLLIPVLKNADTLSLSDVVSQSIGLVQRARAGKPKPDDLNGATISISNLGIYPVESLSALISPGQGAMLAIGSISEEAIVENKQLVLSKVMRITLSADHRVMDGVVSGEFLAELKRLLENPILLLA